MNAIQHSMRARSADNAFAAAMQLEGRGFSGAPLPAVEVKRATAPATPLKADDADLGVLDTGGPLGVDILKLVHGRLLIQGASGSGKSWTLRRLLEQTAGAIQQIVVDPEGEFLEYANAYGLLILDGARLDTAAIASVARGAREKRLSLLLDVSDLSREDQMKIVTSLLKGLVEAPKEHWHPCMVAIDEAHLFAPFGGQGSEATSVRKAAIAALTDLMSRGRKRGLAGVLATQRIARMAKSVISEAHNYLIGINTLDIDIRRAAATIGWDAGRAFDRLPLMNPGDFVVVGPAFSRSPAMVRIGPVATMPAVAAPKLDEPEMIEPDVAARMLDLDNLIEASAVDAQIIEENRHVPGVTAVRAFLRHSGFETASRIWTELKLLAPEGARIAEMPSALEVPAGEIGEALVLLDQYGVLEFMGEGDERIVRAKGSGQ